MMFIVLELDYNLISLYCQMKCVNVIQVDWVNTISFFCLNQILCNLPNSNNTLLIVNYRSVGHNIPHSAYGITSMSSPMPMSSQDMFLGYLFLKIILLTNYKRILAC